MEERHYKRMIRKKNKDKHVLELPICNDFFVYLMTLLGPGLQAGRPGFDFRLEQRFCLYSTESRPVLGPAEPPIQRVPGPLSPGVKWTGHEADYSSPSSTEVKNGGDILHSLYTSSWRGV
jgi:hypothetical protein